VHAYTASGAVVAFAAALDSIDGNYRRAFLLMVLATAIDSTDGLLARLARVKEATPGFDGARLDDIVDYLTFVFVPMLLLHLAGDLPPGWGPLVVGVVLLSSAYGFASTDAKTEDYFFTGFPSYWNIIAVYLHAGGLPAAVNGAILVALSALVFVRIGYVYPTRTPVLRGLTNALCAVWGLMVVGIIWTLPDVNRTLLIASLFFPVYYTVLSLTLNARRGRRS
jgi:phosphatidylcholine synthase